MYKLFILNLSLNIAINITINRIKTLLTIFKNLFFKFFIEANFV